MPKASAVQGSAHFGPSGSTSLILHVGFVLTGIVNTLLGPALPFLSSKWSLSDERAGLLFTAQFSGSLVAAFLTCILIPRRGYRFVLLLGFGLMAIGIGALGLGPWTLGLAVVFTFGFGLGLCIPVTNLWISEAAVSRRAGALSILNLAWGVGAVSCPILLALTNHGVNFPRFLLGLASALGVIALLQFRIRDTSAALPTPELAIVLPVARTHRNNGAMVSLGALFFLYVGVESSVGGWVASYANRIEAHPGQTWLVAAAAFWAALLASRAAMPLLLRGLTEFRLTLLGLSLASIGLVILIMTSSESGVLVGAMSVGIGLAPIFPILVACLRHQLGEAANRTGGILFGLASLGGATLPWLVGVVSTRFRSLEAGLVVPLICCLIIIGIQSRSLWSPADGTSKQTFPAPDDDVP
jgi:FHS family glucose/mannose:H+ symporter-like MFS transporter